MKLYGVRLSPYYERVLLQLRHKGLMDQVEVPGVPGGDMKSADYLVINPMGKIPCLQTADFILTESWAISEYLEEKYPETPMLSGTAEEKARIRAIGRVCDFEVLAPVGELYTLVKKLAEAAEQIATAFLKLDRAIACIEMYLDADSAYAVGTSYSLADLSLVTNMFFLTGVYQTFGRDIFACAPKLKAWFAHHGETEVYQESAKVRAVELVAFQKRKAEAAKAAN